jgi:hypothetical protein
MDVRVCGWFVPTMTWNLLTCRGAVQLQGAGVMYSKWQITDEFLKNKMAIKVRFFYDSRRAFLADFFSLGITAEIVF